MQKPAAAAGAYLYKLLGVDQHHGHQLLRAVPRGIGVVAHGRQHEVDAATGIGFQLRRHEAVVGV
jgi:hypothetical protein